MTEIHASSPPQGVDGATLGGWLTAHVPGVALPLEVELISGGRSNLTYRVTDAGGASYVLRRPPPAVLQATAHDVIREWRIVAALDGTPIPVARAVACCADADVIGAPFAVTSFVGGRTVADPDAALALSPASRRRAGDELTTVLAALHELDVAAIGLGELVRPGGYLERQLRRWGRQLDGYDELVSPLAREVQAELTRRVPTEQRVSLVHGDYKLGNLRVSDDGLVLAVLDWELTAVGDPLADLGWLLASWSEPGEDGDWIVAPPTEAPGFPGRAELVAAYAAKSGLDVSEVDYYVAFALWRWSCINEGMRARLAAAAGPDPAAPDPRRVEAQIAWQLERAWSLLRGAEAA